MATIVSRLSQRNSSISPWLGDHSRQYEAPLVPRSVPDKLVAALPGAKASRFLTGLLLGMIGGLGLLTGAAIMPAAFGHTPLVVVSGSMEPTLHAGDIAVTRSIETHELRVGDVVTYRSKPGLITHRIVGLEVTSRGLLFQMKGDANLTADPRPIPAERIAGKVMYRVPRVGFLVSSTDSAAGLFLLIVAPVLLLALMWIADRRSGANR